MVLRFVIICTFLTATSAVALAQEDYKRSQYYRGVTFQHSVTHVTEADIDGNGSKEVLICYREPGDAVNQLGGILILSREMGGLSIAWHALFESVYPKKVSVNGKALTFEFVQNTMNRERTVSKTLIKGQDFFFRNEQDSPFFEVDIKATSTLKKDGVSPSNVMDGNLKTAWAEGAEGTGVDEKVTLEFKKPVGIGLIGVLHGNYRSRNAWRDNNRIHRAEVTIETSSDRYDADSDVDFEADLGLGLYGDRLELNFSNKPVMRYFKLAQKGVMSVEFKITSVLLGEKNDDTYVSEIDLAELIPASVIFGTEPKPEKKKEKAKPVEEEVDEEEDDWTEEDDGF